MLQFVYREPIAAQDQLMATHNLGGHGPHTSFDTNAVPAAVQGADEARRRGCHGKGRAPRQHHGRPRLLRRRCWPPPRTVAYNMFKDDMVFAIYEAVTNVSRTRSTAACQCDAFKSEWDVLSVATGSRRLRRRLHPVAGYLHRPDGDRSVQQALPQLRGDEPGPRRGRRAAQR